MSTPVAKTIRLSISATMLGLSQVQLGAEEVFTDAQWNQTAAVAPRAQPTGEVVGKSLLSIGLSLAFVLALAVFLGWLVKRLGVKRLVQAKGSHLSVVDTVSLGFKRQASLVRLGNQVVLVGVGEHEVTHLGTFPAAVLDQEQSAAVAVAATEVGTPTSPPAPAEPPDPAFRALRSGERGAGSGEPDATFHNLLNSVLKR